MARNMKALIRSFILLPVFAGVASFALPVFAQITISNTQGAHAAICNVFAWMFWILMSVSVIMIMYAAYLFVTAQDDASQFTEAKQTMLYAAIGIVAALVARGFPLVIGGIFGAQGIQGC
jgi:Type IV secretion system pilin